MRQTLLRIVPEWWTWESTGSNLFVGTGFLVLAWAAYGVIWWGVQTARSSSSPGPQKAFVGWAVVALFLCVIPRLPSGGVPIFGYGLMLFLGFISACWSANRRAASVGLSPELGWDLGMWIFFGGIIGARLWYLIQYHTRIFAGKQGVELIQAAGNLSDGGLVLYGGVVVGTFGFLFYCWRKRVSVLLAGDIAMPSIFIGLAFGRFGCFLNGCCYGDRCGLPWGIRFPQDSVPFKALVSRGFLDPAAVASFPLHPTQLYSVLNATILAAITAVYFRYRPRNGAVLAVGFIIYPLSRLVIELLRGDEPGQFGTGLTISQLFSLCLSAASLAYLCYLTLSPRPPATEMLHKA